MTEHSGGYVDHGSIEGTLKEGATSFFLTDPLYSHQIRVFPNSDLNLALSAIGKRVEISGEIAYCGAGVPQSITADDITDDSMTVFPDDSALPTAADVLAAFAAGPD